MPKGRRAKEWGRCNVVLLVLRYLSALYCGGGRKLGAESAGVTLDVVAYFVLYMKELGIFIYISVKIRLNYPVSSLALSEPIKEKHM